jgi:tetratricopeptide (TPR) repeat protein
MKTGKTDKPKSKPKSKSKKSSPPAVINQEASGEQLENPPLEIAPPESDSPPAMADQETPGEQPETPPLETASSESDSLPAVADQETPGEQPETPPLETASSESDSPPAVTDQEAPDEQPETLPLETSQDEPDSARKEDGPSVLFALFAIIAGIVIALIYNAARDDSPTATEASETLEIAQAESTPPVSETATSPSAKTTVGAEDKAKTESETSQAALRMAPDELAKLKSLENEASSNRKTAGEYFRRGDYENALIHYQKAQSNFEQLLPYYKQSSGNEHDNTIPTRKNLAAVYNAIGDVCRNQKNYTEALNWLNKALEIRENIQGKNHPETAETYNSIALVYDSQEQYAKALKWYQKDLAISEKTLGSEHPDTARIYNNMGMAYFHQGDRANALELFKKALAIQEKKPVDQNPNVAMTYNNIAEVYRAQGDYVLALPQYLKAYRILLNTFGERHSTTMAVRLNLARAYDKLDNAMPFGEWLEESLQ